MIAKASMDGVLGITRRMFDLAGRCGAEFLATILDMDQARVRAEFIALRPIRRWLLVALISLVICTVLGTGAILVCLPSSSLVALPRSQGEAFVASQATATYDDIISRPLFFKDRQPVTVPENRMSNGNAGDLQMSLKGVLINQDFARAFVVSAQNPAGEWWSRGEYVGGMRLVDVLRDKIIVEFQSERIVLPLTHSTGR